MARTAGGSDMGWRTRVRHTRIVARSVADELVWVVLVSLARQRWLTRRR